MTLTSLEESLEGGRAVLGMVMCGRVSFSHAPLLSDFRADSFYGSSTWNIFSAEHEKLYRT